MNFALVVYGGAGPCTRQSSRVSCHFSLSSFLPGLVSTRLSDCSQPTKDACTSSRRSISLRVHQFSRSWRASGGVGFTREYQFLEPGELSYQATNHTVRAKGAADGAEAVIGRYQLNPDESGIVELSTFERITVNVNDILRIERPGGGGYGNPHDLPPEAVLKDVRKGVISCEAARDVYGVAIVDGEDGLTVDKDMTTKLRN